MSIQITNLSKRYGEQLVLNNISLHIGTGEVVGFLGPNGAGKTTTMKIITGSVPYETGSVKVCDMEVKEHRLETNALTGYLPEQNPLYTDMYVKEYLMFVADTYRLGRKRRQRTDELIELVGLTREAGKKIGQLSKGYRQRVGLAQALMPDPKVLILDEPTTGLDPNQLEDIRALIRRIGNDRTVLLSTHIMQEINAICNRVVIINRGEIVTDYNDLHDLSIADRRDVRVEVEFLNVPDTATLPGTVLKAYSDRHFVLSAQEDIRAALFDRAVTDGNKLLTLKPIENSMEDIFRKLTRDN